VGSRKPVKVNAGGDLYTLENEADTEVNGSRDILSSSACNRLDKVKRYTREIVVRGHADWNVLEEVLMTMQHLGHLKSVANPDAFATAHIS